MILFCQNINIIKCDSSTDSKNLIPDQFQTLKGAIRLGGEEKGYLGTELPCRIENQKLYVQQKMWGFENEKNKNILTPKCQF